MPFRHLYREQMTPGEFQTPGAICIVHPEYEEQAHSEMYHEMDFTATTATAQNQSTSQPPKRSYSTMDVDDDFKLTYRSSNSPSHDESSFSYSHLLDIEGSQPESVPSLRTNSMANSTTSDDRPIIGATADELICPLITGETEMCHPERCGPNAPCMKYTDIPPIEECTNVPCISTPTKLERAITEPEPTPIRPKKAETKMTKADAKRRAKQAHSLVEKKYRENLNSKLVQLHETLKTTRYGPKKNKNVEDDESDDFTVVGNNNGKFKKGEVLDDALDYINQTEVEMRHMENELARMTDMVTMMERRLKYESARHKGVHMSVRPG
jgi:hypothetical protein